MNSVCISGRITKDIELRKTQSGLSVTKFDVAVKRPRVKDKTDFIRVVCWRQTAEFVERYFSKGDWIEVNGSITTDKYTDDNGNTRYLFEIEADNVGFGGSSKSSDNKAATENTEYDGMEDVDDDDVPF